MKQGNTESYSFSPSKVLSVSPNSPVLIRLR